MTLPLYQEVSPCGSLAPPHTEESWDRTFDIGWLVRRLEFEVLVENKPYEGRIVLHKNFFPPWVSGWEKWSRNEVCIGGFPEGNLNRVIREIHRSFCSFCEEMGHTLNPVMQQSLLSSLEKCPYEKGHRG